MMGVRWAWWVLAFAGFAVRSAAQTLVPLPALSSPDHDIAIGWDGTSLYVNRIAGDFAAGPGTERRDVAARRGVGFTEFSAPERLSLSPFDVAPWGGTGAIAHVAVDAARGMAVFSARNAAGDFDLYVVHREEQGGWTVPRPLDGLNTQDQEVYPQFVRGRLVFGSDRAGGMGGYDLYAADREAAWARATGLPAPYNGPGDDVALVGAVRGDVTGGADWGPGYVASAREGSRGIDVWAVLPDEQEVATGWDYALEWRRSDGTPWEGARVRVEELGGPVRVQGVADARGWISLGGVAPEATHRVALESAGSGGGMCHLWGRNGREGPWIRLRTFRFAAGEVFVFDLLPFDRVELPEGESADLSQLVAPPRMWWVPFGVDVDQISPQAARDLVAWVTAWKSDGGWPRGLQVEVRGHADTSGSPQRNTALSMSRARAVADALTAEGIPASALVVSGAGSAEPPPAGISPRRVEVRLVWGR
jgi:hypothetical protein